jgi:dimethylhistidine N-methyltransferase
MERAQTRTAPLPSDPLAREVWEGLSASPKYLPSKLFYDAEGSALFEQITSLPEYYLTRSEHHILADHGAALAALASPCGQPVVLIEPGCGSSTKAATILQHLPRAAYVGVDISPAALASGAAALAELVPHVQISSVAGDYTRPGWAPAAVPRGRRVAFFPGSTLGNFEPEAAAGFLGRLARLVGSDGLVIVGADLWKSPALLEPAYDDAQGVTAAFNRNALAHLARRYGLDIDPQRFRHRIVVDRAKHRVEMHLVSDGPQTLRLWGGVVRLGDGESIHTESCYKWPLEEIRALAGRAGLVPVGFFTDFRGWFGVHAFAVLPADGASTLQ